MEKHISSGAIVYKKKGETFEVLVMHRMRTNSWHLPKGTQNNGETIEETAVREVKEETGLDIKLKKYIGLLESEFLKDNILTKKETHYFISDEFSGDINDHDKEHDKVCFLDYNTALSHLENFSLYEKEGKILKMAEPFFA